VRLFVAVEVPDAVRAAVSRVERPDGPDVRWSASSSWHVTLRFLGEVEAPEPALAALRSVVAAPTVAALGRTPRRLGSTVVVLPVSGLDAVAAAVADAFAELPGEAERGFHGHLTLGRLRRPGRWPRHGVGPLGEEVAWAVDAVALVRSHLAAGAPARYEVLARHRLVDPGEGA
jgi:RNA 2',3'-cyclic 3'-phosphodiesterase